MRNRNIIQSCLRLVNRTFSPMHDEVIKKLYCAVNHHRPPFTGVCRAFEKYVNSEATRIIFYLTPTVCVAYTGRSFVVIGQSSCRCTYIAAFGTRRAADEFHGLPVLVNAKSCRSCRVYYIGCDRLSVHCRALSVCQVSDTVGISGTRTAERPNSLTWGFA